MVIKKKKKLILLCILLIAGYLRFNHLELLHYDEFSDRDCFRTASLINQFKIPFQGPELKGYENKNCRTPGSFVYFLLIIPMLISQHPMSVAIFVVILNLAAIFLCYKFCEKYFDFPTALIATILFSFSPSAIILSRRMWHPSMTIPFNILFFYFLFRLVIERKSNSIIYLSILFSILLQLHMSYIMLIPILAVTLFLCKPYVSRLYILTSVLIILIMFYPYLYYESFRNFNNTANIVKTFLSKSTPDILFISKIFFKENVPFINMYAFSLMTNMITFVPNFEKELVGNIAIWWMLHLFHYFDILLLIFGVGYIFKKIFQKNTVWFMEKRKYLIILFWLFIPVILLSTVRITDDKLESFRFFNFFSWPTYNLEKRYLNIIYPSLYIIIAIGLMHFIREFQSANRKKFQEYFLQVIIILCIIGLAVKAYYIHRYVFLPEDPQPEVRRKEYISSLKAILDISKTLVYELGITKGTFITNVSTRGLGNDGFDYVFLYYLNKNKYRINNTNNFSSEWHYLLVPIYFDTAKMYGVKIKRIILKEGFKIVGYKKVGRNPVYPRNNFLNPYILGQIKNE